MSSTEEVGKRAPAVQWLRPPASKARGVGSISGQGIELRSHMPSAMAEFFKKLEEEIQEK